MKPFQAQVNSCSSRAELQKQAAEARRDALRYILEEGKEKLHQGEKELEANLEAIWSHTLEFIEESNKFHADVGLFSPWWKSQANYLQNDSEYRQMEDEQGCRLQEIKEIQREITDLESISTVHMQQEAELMQDLKSSEDEIAKLQKEQQILRQEPFAPEFLSLKAKIQRSKNMCSQLQILAPLSIDSLAGDSADDSAPHAKDSLDDNSSKTKTESVEEPIPPPSNMKIGSDIKRVRKVFKMREKTTVTLQRQFLQNYYGDRNGSMKLMADGGAGHFMGENSDISHS